jgi:hypothetical protein
VAADLFLSSLQLLAEKAFCFDADVDGGDFFPA